MNDPVRTNKLKPWRFLSNLSLASCLLLQPVLLAEAAPAAAPKVITGDVSVTVVPSEVQKPLAVKNGWQRVTMVFRDIAVADALRALARKGAFNVAIDESVDNHISVDLRNVTINDALATLKNFGNLSYGWQGDMLIAASANSPKGRALMRDKTNMFSLKYANAAIVSKILNDTVLANTQSTVSGGQGQASLPIPKVTPDFRTNSVVVVGTSSDMRIASEYIKALDIPRETKTWRLSHGNAVDVSSLLSSSLYNDGIPSINLQTGLLGGGQAGLLGAQQQGGGSQQGGNNFFEYLPSSLRTRVNNIRDGQGASDSTNGSSGSGGSGSSNASNITGNNLSVRNEQKVDEVLSISANGAIIIPDTRVNTITILGTTEQIALADELIAVFDRKAPQVVLEASLVEMTEEAAKQLGFNFGVQAGGFSFGGNNTGNGTNPLSRAVGITNSTTTPTENLWRFATNPVRSSFEITYQINSLLNNRKAKLLANPTIVAIHDKEAIVSMVDEVVRSVQVTLNTANSTGAASGDVVGSQANIGEAGIVLNILPKIGMNQDFVSLRVRPTISSVRDTQTDAFGNLITLLTKREVVTQNVILRDGESFVLGGLLKDIQSSDVSKFPLLSDLPIVGALARNSNQTKNRTELVIVITPHIVRGEDTLDAVSNAATNNAAVGSANNVPSFYNQKVQEAARQQQQQQKSSLLSRFKANKPQQQQAVKQQQAQQQPVQQQLPPLSYQQPKSQNGPVLQVKRRQPKPGALPTDNAQVQALLKRYRTASSATGE